MGKQTTEKQLTRTARAALALMLRALVGIVLPHEPSKAAAAGVGFKTWRQDETQNHNAIGMILWAISTYPIDPAAALAVARLCFTDQVRFGHCSSPLRKDEAMTRSHWAWNATAAALALLFFVLVEDQVGIQLAIAWWRCEQACNLLHRMPQLVQGVRHVAAAGGRDCTPDEHGAYILVPQEFHRDLTTAWCAGDQVRVPLTASPDSPESVEALDMTALWALQLVERVIVHRATDGRPGSQPEQAKRGGGYVRAALFAASVRDLLPFRNPYHLFLVESAGFVGWWDQCDAMERPGTSVRADFRSGKVDVGCKPEWGEQQHVTPAEFPKRPAPPAGAGETIDFPVASGQAA